MIRILWSAHQMVSRTFIQRIYEKKLAKFSFIMFFLEVEVSIEIKTCRNKFLQKRILVRDNGGPVKYWDRYSILARPSLLSLVWTNVCKID